MEMEVSLRVEQEIRVRTVHLIELSNLMKVPDEVLNAIVSAVSYSPDSVESILRETRQDVPHPDSAAKAQTLYSSLIPSKGDSGEGKEKSGRRRQGLIISPDVRALEARLVDCQIAITPDVTYIGRRNERPELVLSEHLKGSMGFRLLQLDASKYPEASKLLAQLRKFDEWKRTVLIDAYTVLGGVQREFFEGFDTARYHVFTQQSLADRLGISVSTVSRILSNRLVGARNLGGKQKLLYAKDLIVAPNDLKRYAAVPKLNKALAEEFERGGAFTDEELLKRARGMARRTVTKYRLASGIPHYWERDRAYKSGERGEPYVIVP